MDGHQQRRALTAAEQAIRHLGSGNAAGAIEAADRAVDLDQIDVFAGLPAAVRAAGADLAEGGVVTGGTWEAVSAAVGPGPLAFLVDEVRAAAPGAASG